MRGKKQISAVILAVILGVSAGIPKSMVYAEPANESADTNESKDKAAEEKKEEDMTPEEREKKAEEDAYKMEIQSNIWRGCNRDGRRNGKHFI